MGRAGEVGTGGIGNARCRRHGLLGAVGILMALALFGAACGAASTSASPRSIKAQDTAHGAHDVAAGSSTTGAASHPGPANAAASKVLLSAYKKTVTASSAAFQVRASIAGKSGALATPLVITASGSADLATGDLDATVDLPGLSSLPGLAGGMLGGTSPTGASPSPASTMSIRIEMVHGQVYIELPAAVASLFGKSWISIDLASLASSTGANLGPLASIFSGDPTAFLDWIQGATGHVSTVGTATIDGHATTEYQSTVDLAKLAATAGKSLPVRVSQSLPGLLGFSTLTVDVWVGAHGHVRQVTTVVSLSGVKIPGGSPAASAAAGDLNGATATLQVDFMHFGIPVSVSAPPASEVLQISSLLKGVLGNLGSLANLGASGKSGFGNLGASGKSGFGNLGASGKSGFANLGASGKSGFGNFGASGQTGPGSGGQAGSFGPPGSTTTPTTTPTSAPPGKAWTGPTTTTTVPGWGQPQTWKTVGPGTASLSYSGVVSGQLVNAVSYCHLRPNASSDIRVNGTLNGTPWVLFIQSYDGESGVWQVLTGQAGGSTGLLGQGYGADGSYPAPVSGVTQIDWTHGATLGVQMTSRSGQTPAGNVTVQGTANCG